MPKPWRALEQLVRDLERMFAGEQVTIKSPDAIPDRTTGRTREVDVSIRVKVGSVDVLVILECRRRGDPEDVTWIEQLATKGHDIGASKVVAVSSARFTSGAIDKARSKNIELRTFSEVTEAVALRWLGGVAYNYELVDVAVTVKKAPEIGLVAGVHVPLGATRVQDMIFVRLIDGAAMSIFDMLPMTEAFSRIANDFPLGERNSLSTNFGCPPGQIGIVTRAGVAEVADVSVNAWIERRIATATSLSYQYVNQDGTVLADGTQLTLDHFGAPIVVNFVRHGEGVQKSSFAVRRDDHDTERILAYNFAFIDDDGQAITTSGVAQAEPEPAKKGRSRSRKS